MSHILVVKSAYLLPGVLVQCLGHHLQVLGLLPLGLLDLLENILPLLDDLLEILDFVLEMLKSLFILRCPYPSQTSRWSCVSIIPGPSFPALGLHSRHSSLPLYLAAMLPAQSIMKHLILMAMQHSSRFISFRQL